MKLLKYGIMAIAAGLVFGLSACSDDSEYTPAEQLENDQVFFSATATDDVNLEADQSSFVVEINRLKSNGDLTVALTSTVTDQTGATVNFITVPSSVTFSSGQSSAAINVDVDFSQVDPSDEYTVTISIASENSTPYGKRSQEILVYYAPWSEWEELDGDAMYTLSSPYGGAYDNPVYSRYSLLDKNMVQYNLPEFWDYDLDMIINVNLGVAVDAAEGLYQVRVSPQQNHDTQDGSAIWYCDMYSWVTQVISSPNYPPASYEKTSYFNVNTGVITIDMKYYFIQAGSVYSWGNANAYIQLPGYPDLSMTFSNNGSYISEDGQEYALINVVKGSDIASYAITLVEGWLEGDEASVQEVADELAANTSATVYTESQQMQFPIDEENYYTVVTVQYDESGAVIGNAAYSFNYEMVQKDWDEGWTTVSDSAVFTDGWNILSSSLSWEVTVQENDYYPGYYRIVKPYGDCPYLDASDIDRGHFYIEIDATDPDAVEVLPSLTSIGFYFASIGSAFGYSGTGTFDGNTFTFPGQSLLVYYGSYGWVTFYEVDEDDEEDDGMVDLLVLDPSKETSANALSRSIAPLKLDVAKKQAKKTNVNGANPALKSPVSIDVKKVNAYKKSHGVSNNGNIK